MKKTKVIILIAAGICLITGGILILVLGQRSKSDLFMVGFAMIAGGTYLLYKSLLTGQKFNPAWTGLTLHKKFELIGITTTVIVFFYELLALNFSNIDMRPSGGSDGWFYAGPLAFIALIIVGSFMWARKKKMTVYDYFTLKAKDEREQQLIDQAGRKAYALIRLLLPLLGFIIISGLINPASFSIYKVFILLMTITIVGELFFRFFTRSISEN